MFNLDLQLRTPGRILLLERNAAQALVDRAFEARPQQQGSGWLPRMMQMFGRPGRAQAMDDDGDEGPRERLAMPAIRWAGEEIEYGAGYAIVDGIAIIDIKGVLTPEGYVDWWEYEWVDGYLQIGAAVEAANADTRIRGVFLRVNSPGGFVDGCFDLAKRMREMSARAGGKPIWVHAQMACSAAYALASAADRILAPAEGDVGSIGVLIQHVDMSKMLEEWGIKVEAIQSAPRKTDGAAWKPLTDEARAHLQGVVDQIARTFVGTVVAGRGLTEEAIRAQEARWFMAEHDDPEQSGLALGLCDEIANERDAFALFTKSLSGETESGAPAAAGSTVAATAARADATTETEMSLKDQIKALREKAAKGDAAAIAELKALGVAPKAEAEPAKEDDAEDDVDAKSDETEEEVEEDDEDEDKEPAAKAKGTKAGFALLNAKEANGRDGLAKKLAAKVGAGKLTYGEAKDMLASAPKASRLANSVRDHNPGGDTGASSKAGAGLTAAVDRMVATKKR